jgi:glycosyltransferase involved in cell wall biosynthesis
VSRAGSTRARRPAVAALVEATGDPTGAVGTVSALAGIVVDGAPLQIVVVSTSPVPPLPPASHLTVSVPGASHGDALARGLAAVRADRIVYLRAGVTPSSGFVAEALEAHEREHGAALLAATPIDGTSGRPRPTPPGVSFTGHPLPPSSGDELLGASSGADVVDPAVEVGRRTVVPGPAWVAHRAELEAVGSFDLRLDHPFVGIDLAWRAWLAGREVIVDPALTIASSELAVEAATVPSTTTPHAAIRAEVDALCTIYRNLDDVSLGSALPAALDLSPARLADRVDGDLEAGVRSFTALLPDLERERADRQADRLRPDAEMLGVLPGPSPAGSPTATRLRPDSAGATFVAAQASVVGRSPALQRFEGRLRVVVATADSITAKMAGPAIRAWRVAQELALDHEVRLVSLTRAELADPLFSVEVVRHADVNDLVDWCDVFVFQGWVMAGLESFQRSDKVFVADIYDPLHLEQLEQARDDGERIRRRAVRDATAVLNEQLLRGDFFLCASTKQRDLWLGHLASLGRVNPATYDADPGLDSLIDIVPFGISDDPPQRTGPGIRGVVPGVGPDDAVILWGGGVYNWFDPLTLIRAVDRLRTRRPDVRLVFLGMKHPNPDIPEMRMAVEARRLADDLGLTGVHVFFNEEWVPYEHRQNFLLDADVAVTTHFHHVETDYSFRTRVLDYLWATLPTVATSGDSLADLIERRGLGITVPPQDADALADALFALLDDKARAEACRENIRAAVPDLVWSRTLRPLVEFCRAPRRAPDLMEGLIGEDAGPHPTELTPAPRGLGADVALVVRYLREGGPVLLVTKVRNRASRFLRS